jgi:hypothetical protein
MKTPYDKYYVIDRTLENIRAAIEFSTKKTMMRNIEFQDDPVKQKEIMDTLVLLGELHKILDNFEAYVNDEKISR